MMCMAIDPGVTGAVAWVDDNDGCFVADLPVVILPGNGRVKKRVAGRPLALLIKERCPSARGVIAVIEAVGVMGPDANNAVQTQGSLMRTLGAVETVLEMLCYQPNMVQPKTWKKFYGLGADKSEALRVARELYPKAPLQLAKHHNRAEALLMARYGLRMFA